MRNLKRTLSLVLAMALVVGMMMVGASAASSDFVDGDEITYTEAAEIMTALGVFEGTDKGAFDPAGTLTREQAAAIVCRMLLGDDAENVNTNSVVFSDVAADRWSAGYIAYCAQQGILAGTGNGTFDPEGELTGLAFAKMLLVALGYDPAIEQYVGDDWAVNVAADAVDAGIAISGVVMANAVSREQAAQMAYQTLEANMVSYASKGTTVIGSDGMQVIVGASAAEPVDNYITNDYDKSGDNIQQFCERYFSDLKKTDGEDDFKRPAAQWKLKNEIIGTYAAEAEGTYTAGVEKGDLYDLIGRTVYNAITSAPAAEGHADFTVYENGALAKSQTVADYIEDDSTTKVGGNGVLTQVYVDDDTNDVIISMINTYVAKVDGDYDEEDDELVLDDLGLALPAETTLSGEDFENLASFSDGDYVLVTAVGDEIKTIQAAETVTGTVTSYTKEKNVTVDGEKYSYTKGYKGPDKNYTLNSDYDLVLDTYGYVIYADGVETTDEYLFVTKAAKLGGLEENNWEARAYFTDGTTAVIEVSNVGSGEDKVSLAADNNAWYAYNEKNDGTYELTEVTNAKEKYEHSDEDKADNSIVKTGVASLTDSDVRLNNDTVFVIRRGDSVNVYTGIKNVPEITVAKSTVEVRAILDSNGYADYVFINGEAGELGVSGSVAGDRIYILDATDYEASQDADDNRYYIYDAIVNGEIGTVNLNSDGKSVGLYGSVTYDADGYVNAGDLNRIENDTEDTNLKAEYVNSTVKYSGGVLTFGGQALVLADDCTIFLNDNGTGKTITASRLARDYEKDAFKGVISWVVDDDVVTEIYVDAKATVPAENQNLASQTEEQPETAQDIIDRVGASSNWAPVSNVVSLNLTQNVVDNTVYLSGELSAITANTVLTEDQQKGLGAFWGRESLTFAEMLEEEDIVAACANGGGLDEDTVIAFLVVSENGKNHFTIVRETEDGTAVFLTGNGAGTPVKAWPERNFSIDISGLSF